jgi:hypothetical protein
MARKRSDGHSSYPFAWRLADFPPLPEVVRNRVGGRPADGSVYVRTILRPDAGRRAGGILCELCFVPWS